MKDVRRVFLNPAGRSGCTKRHERISRTAPGTSRTGLALGGCSRPRRRASPRSSKRSARRVLEGPSGPDKWTGREVVAHLADVEIGTGFRIRQMVSEPDHVIQPFDQEAWARPYPGSTLAWPSDARRVAPWNLSLLPRSRRRIWPAWPCTRARGGERRDVDPPCRPATTATTWPSSNRSPRSASGQSAG